MNVILAYEHQEIKIQHEGETDSNTLNEAEVEILARIQHDLPKGALSWTADGVRFAQYCGIISLGSTQIEILPKVYGVDQALSRSILVAMLQEAGYLVRPLSQRSQLDWENHSLLDLFILIYCEELLAQFQRGMIKNYQTREENLPRWRGRLRVSEQIKHNLAHQERFYCQYDELTEDNSYNHAFKAALSCLKAKARSFDAKRRVNEILTFFDAVSDRVITATEVRQFTKNRLVKRFEVLLEMSAAFLEGLSPTIQSGKGQSAGLLFDMNKLFEEAIGNRLTKLAQARGLVAKLQGPIKHLMEGNLFQLKPDITLYQSGQCQAVLDTKWKLLDESHTYNNLAQSDLYQMFAYAKNYNCQHITLIYPWTNQVSAAIPAMNFKAGGQVNVALINLKGFLPNTTAPSIDEQLRQLLP